MDAIESYKSNPELRKIYYKMNNIVHGEIWDTDDEMYQPALCSREYIGFPVDRKFQTQKEVLKWFSKYAPELSIIE